VAITIGTAGLGCACEQDRADAGLGQRAERADREEARGDADPEPAGLAILGDDRPGHEVSRNPAMAPRMTEWTVRCTAPLLMGEDGRILGRTKPTCAWDVDRVRAFDRVADQQNRKA
jgi:hypothetical protein